jgi:hypothetical protein
MTFELLKVCLQANQAWIELRVMYVRSIVTDRHARRVIINQNYCIIFFFFISLFRFVFYFFPSIFFISVYFVLLSLVSFHFVSISLISFRFVFVDFVSHFIDTCVYIYSIKINDCNLFTSVFPGEYWNASLDQGDNFH